MVSSISSTESSIQQLMAAMYQKMNAADTDGIAGLSKKELSSIDVGDDVGGGGFLQSLSAQFDKIDTDGNGQLSAKEISSAKPTGPMGPPPGLELNATKSDDATGSTNSIEAMMEKLLKAMMEALSKSQEKLASSDQTTGAKKAIDSLLASADTDGTAGLSANELSAIDTSGNAGKANFVNNLIKNFDKIDTDGNGQLSQSEIIASKPEGPPPEMAVANGSSSSSNGLGNSLSNLSNAFIQKLLSSYQNGDLSGTLSSLTSSLNLAI